MLSAWTVSSLVCLMRLDFGTTNRLFSWRISPGEEFLLTMSSMSSIREESATGIVIYNKKRKNTTWKPVSINTNYGILRVNISIYNILYTTCLLTFQKYGVGEIFPLPTWLRGRFCINNIFSLKIFILNLQFLYSCIHFKFNYCRLFTLLKSLTPRFNCFASN